MKLSHVLYVNKKNVHSLMGFGDSEATHHTQCKTWWPLNEYPPHYYTFIVLSMMSVTSVHYICCTVEYLLWTCTRLETSRVGGCWCFMHRKLSKWFVDSAVGIGRKSTCFYSRVTRKRVVVVFRYGNVRNCMLHRHRWIAASSLTLWWCERGLNLNNGNPFGGSNYM